MWKELFSTDVGLMSLAVIVVALVIGLYSVVFLVKNSSAPPDSK